MDIEQPIQEAQSVVVEATPAVVAAVEPAVGAPVTPVESPDEVPATDVPAVDAPAESESILGDAEAKAAEQKKPEGEKPAEAATEIKDEKPAEVVLPVYEEFKLPENFADKGSLDEFTKVLCEMEIAAGKLDHAGYQAAGQKLVDLGIKATQESVNRLNDYYTQFHENQKKEWFESFKKDPEMGGEKLTETVGALRSAVEEYGGTSEQIAEFRQIMKYTGVGNHPAVTRIIFNMQQKINKYETESDGNRIVPAAKPAPSKVKPYQQFYAGNNS